MSNNIQAVIFDFDGTLINSTDILLELLLEGGRKFGGTVTRDDFMRLNGLTLKDGIRALLKEKKLKKRALLLMLLNTWRVKRALKERIELYPHAADMLSALQDNYRLGIATSGSTDHVEYFTQKLGIRGHFQTVISRNMVVHKKPAPEPYLMAAERLGVDPAHCLAVEDSPYGLLAAKRAGMRTVTILHSTPRKYFTGEFEPDHFADDLSVIVGEILEEI